MFKAFKDLGETLERPWRKLEEKSQIIQILKENKMAKADNLVTRGLTETIAKMLTSRQRAGETVVAKFGSEKQ